MGRNLRFALIALVLSGLIAAGCGGGGSGTKTAVPTTKPQGTAGTLAPSATPRTPIPTVTPRPTKTPLGSAADEAAITSIIDRGMAAIQARDSAALRALFASDAQVADAEINTLLTCMADTTRTQDAPSFQFLRSDLARAAIKFERTPNGQTPQPLQGFWEFQKLPGPGWVFYVIPFCPQ